MAWRVAGLALLVLVTISNARSDSFTERQIVQIGCVDSDLDVPANEVLLNHNKFFCPDPVIYDLRDSAPTPPPQELQYQAYLAVGYNLANTVILIGPSGDIVIFDTLGNTGSVEDVIADMRSNGVFPSEGSLPIKAIIYSHNHVDHVGGIKGYLDASQWPACDPENPQFPGGDEDLDIGTDGCTAIIAQELINDAVTNYGTVVGRMIGTRSAYMYGILDETQILNAGIGPAVKGLGAYYVMPSRTFTSTLRLTVGGMRLRLQYLPSETNDEVIAFLYDNGNGVSSNSAGTWEGSGLLLSAEVIQGPSFPNLYSLRGTGWRDPSTWYKSVDVLRTYDAWGMAPSHGIPLYGNSNIQTLLRLFRDAIQFTHDQAIRQMRLGMTMRELDESISLPAYFLEDLEELSLIIDADPKDYLTALYGSVSQSVRAVYVGKLGWFNGDPVDLKPLGLVEEAERYVAMMGGRPCILATARQSLVQAEAAAAIGDEEVQLKEAQWAAELTTYLIRINNDDTDAKTYKAEAFELMASPQSNPNWRYWYLGGAKELRGEIQINGEGILNPLNGLIDPQIVNGLPASSWVESWITKVKAESLSGTQTLSFGLWYYENQGFEPQGFVMTLRGAICQITVVEDLSQLRSMSDVAVNISKTLQNVWQVELRLFVPMDEVVISSLGSGRANLLKGDLELVREFWSYFDDWYLRGIPAIVVRPESFESVPEGMCCAASGLQSAAFWSLACLCITFMTTVLRIF
mmetsp:Transcript_5352/g.15082  ORF Transcript_5352/g.15082 Transcript_5352/m.15082 type:complete len:744 (-) Transcript_5352:134-2365(-)|eukprot:CAMPEP_0119130928 /NCGR_PEP_ID=MMETSP1310-20130426/9041_1 /TAXON_ID=464262 /ORGANISM="Genus nov. species nov., Strain RCC2339" /LENGTH=743 /DNA_ID=CAMNT_0007121469 /DNA_START=68 /DNA_END=2299 /DNA_ORIENTATION=-